MRRTGDDDSIAIIKPVSSLLVNFHVAFIHPFMHPSILHRVSHLLYPSRYYKTGSLMANSCKAIAMLGCYPDYVCTAAFRYGLHVGECRGYIFHMIDDHYWL